MANDEPQSLDELAAEGDMQDDILGRIADLEAERDDFRDKFMRALADTENTRKRSERDRREAENYGGSKLARDMLPVYDNMRRALRSVEEEGKEVNKALLEG
ncbi:MAG: nucleotide exchange factor GrpE, partial [Loktanella sp.]|nr:nucleotide exchange factor GrpE [Loktanella sp.]